MKVFRQFAKTSKLQISFDKTQVVRLGALKYTDTIFPMVEPLQWVKETKILGILVNANKKKMLERNYEILLKKFKSVLTPWKSRVMTLMGKILIINTLMALQAVYKFLVLDTPDESFFKKN